MNPEDIAAGRFKPVRQAREHIAKVEVALAQSHARLQELRGSVAAAKDADKKALGAALVAGKIEPESEAKKLEAEIAGEERRAEALAEADADARKEIGRLVDVNRRNWRGQAMRSLSKAKGRYEDAIAELEAAREGLSNEATLISWLDSGTIESAAMDLLGGRSTIEANRTPVSFGRTVDELRRDCEHLAAYPVSRSDPHPEPRFELAYGGGSKQMGDWG